MLRGAAANVRRVWRPSSIAGTVVAPPATATADGLAPGLSLLLGVPVALGTAASVAPVPEIRLLPSAAGATADGLVPGLSLLLGVTVATATAAVVAPTPTITVLPSAAAATAAGLAPTPAITILPAPAAATAAGLVPTISVSLTRVAPAATATAAGLVPVPQITIVVSPATATAAAPVPALLILRARWVTPRTWTVGYLVRAGDLNTEVSENTLFLYDPAAVKRTRTVVDQSITSGTDTAITFTATKFDADKMVDGANASRVICQVAGKYALQGRGIFAAGATGFRRASVRLNGSTVVAETALTAVGSGAQTHVPVRGHEKLSVGDYLELVLHHTQGAALNCGGDLELVRVGG